MKRYRIRPFLVRMNVGDSAKFPISHLTSVRAAASETGLAMQRTYKTKTNRDQGFINVSRIK